MTVGMYAVTRVENQFSPSTFSWVYRLLGFCGKYLYLLSHAAGPGVIIF